MAKKKAEKLTKSWVRLDDIDKGEPSTEITLASVIQFRNGLAKVYAGKNPKPGTLTATLIYRSMLDLDHLARLLDAENRRSTMTMTYVIKATTKDSAKKVAAFAKKSKWQKVKS
jgi:hypothetical protein